MPKRPKPPSKRRHPPGPGPGRDEKIRTVTRMIVAFGRQCGDDDDAIRTSVRAAIREALEGDESWKMPTIPPGGGAPVEAVTTAGMYRLIFEAEGIDRGDQFQQERWLAIVQRALDEALRETDGDFRRRGPGERIFDPRPDA
jgi:hypothetical protein